jgi:hypothetical protein
MTLAWDTNPTGACHVTTSLGLVIMQLRNCLDGGDVRD